MIQIERSHKTYTCPYCRHDQSFAPEKFILIEDVGFYKGQHIPCTGSLTHFTKQSDNQDELDKSLFIYSIRCANPYCRKITVVGFDKLGKQHDIFPQKEVQQFPDYIPKQIRQDYTEGSCILSDSPKAAATLFRRCLQGIIRDFWDVKPDNLNNEIKSIKSKIPLTQWNAIDALRKIGNIGAHMEKDVNLIIDIDESEAERLQKLIELLFKNWYIARHDDEMLCNEIVDISNEKQIERGK